jgi:hypothetical protein
MRCNVSGIRPTRRYYMRIEREARRISPKYAALRSIEPDGKLSRLARRTRAQRNHGCWDSATVTYRNPEKL